ncbi:ABC transporter permease [Mesoplasma syrphidae]|uniref:ABC transporter permease n=1 Tax=Mesoplasma syrphidae TaxID=225999 RepID=A0A2K9BNT9_9MOLU|nr:oligopeptide ABC transporter permease OppB [Mesoplasma syrphidae]AUF83703.1 ABC transporter permease [Mesoplasma syrphidae]
MIKNKETISDYSIKKKAKQKAFDINSVELNLDDELMYGKPSRFRALKYQYEDFNANLYKFFRAHPLIGYSFKRIVYGFLTLLAAIIILFLLVNAVTDVDQYMPENWDKLGLIHGSDRYNKFLEDRMKLFGVYGSVTERLFLYLKNITPFIPKTIVTGETIYFSSSPLTGDGGMTTALLSNALKVGGDGIWNSIVETKTVWVYLGVVSSKSIGTPGSTEILELFNKAIPYSFAFGSVSVIISYLIGVPLGIQAAKRKGKPSDNIINGANILLVAAPAVVIIIGVYLLSISVFGHSAMFNSGSFWTKFWPVVALVLLMTPSTVILTRRYVIDEMTADYTKFAYAKGMGESKVYYIHIFRNAGIRIIRQFPLDLAVTLFGASILTEQQWGIPGMSPFIVKAVSGTKDSFVILGFISFAAFVRIFASLVSDLTMVWMDPRVSLGNKK